MPRGGDPERDPNSNTGTTLTNDPTYNAALDDAIARGNASAAASANGQSIQDYLASLTGGGGYGGGGGSRYAPFDVGAGKTKWDEFTQQMQLEQQKLQQAQDIENARLAQEKALAEEKLQEEQKIADQNTVEAYNKSLLGMQGPKDPYGYLFASRGLSAPQGYAPVAAPIPQAVLDQYSKEGVDLKGAQQQLVGGSGPSFINGMLGGLPSTFQQGPMGFQNAPSMKDVAPGSQSQQPPSGAPQQPSPTGAPPAGGLPTGLPGPIQMATGGTIPGYAPGMDMIPAMLSPGEGILRPQAVQAMGGPNVVQQLNAQSPNPSEAPKPEQEVTQGGIQKFADGGTVQSDPFNLRGPELPQPAPASYQGGAGVAMPGLGGMPQQQITPTQVGNNWQIAGQNVGQNSWENAPSPGYQMTSPGVAMPFDPRMGGIGVGRPAIFPPIGGGMGGIGDFQFIPGNAPPGWNIPGQTGVPGPPMVQPRQPWGPPFGPPLPWGPPPPPNSGVPQLTGGVLTPPAPPGGSPINLNMLDPYTRALVDQYGRPQIPSAQALANMPQSGLDAYQNYVEKVAGGNFQDLIDQSRSLNPAGENPANLRFT